MQNINKCEQNHTTFINTTYSQKKDVQFSVNQANGF